MEDYIVIDNKKYTVPKRVLDLMLSICRERDYWKAKSIPILKGERIN